LSFRSKDPRFKTDPGVLPTPEQAKADGIDIVNTPFQHTDMSDRAPPSVKEKIQATLDNFLGDANSSDLAPAPTAYRFPCWSAASLNCGRKLPPFQCRTLAAQFIRKGYEMAPGAANAPLSFLTTTANPRGRFKKRHFGMS
jgi:hypothetical protein